MPLRAIINGEDILAPFLDQVAWTQLKQRVKQEPLDIRLPCCGAVAYLRTSKHGLNHFVHKERDSCTSAPETWQHLKAKHDIALACWAAGYEAITEACGDGWRADVLATKGKAKIAFEVQWSSQTLEITHERQQQYKEAGIRGCWLFKRPPVQYNATGSIPLFKLQVSEEGATVTFNPYGYESWQAHWDRSVPLSEFIVSLLTGKMRFCDHLRSQTHQKVRIVFTEIDCWKCHRPYHIYYVHHLRTICGDTIEADYFAKQIVALVREFQNSPDGKSLRVGQIKQRYSKTVNEPYMSFGCPHCDAILGDFFLRHEIIPEVIYSEDKAPAILEAEIDLSEMIVEPREHWCYPDDGGFCCG